MSDPGKQPDPATPAPVEPDKQASILFPDEGKPAGDPPADPAKPADTAADPAKQADPADWKEYVADPAKTDEENAAAKAEHDKTKPADPADKVPEDGKYTLTVPDGMKVDEELLAAVAPEFKSLGLTQKQAQALTDKFSATIAARTAKQNETWANTVAGWVDTAKADKDIGGSKWDATVNDAQRAMKRFGSPELKSYLEASGGGNHPEVIRAFAKIGAAIKEDSPPNDGAGGGGKPVEAAHILFPNDKPKG